MIYKVYATDYLHPWELIDVAYNDNELSKILNQLDPRFYKSYMIIRRDLKQCMDEIISIEEVESWKSRKLTFI